MERAELLEKLSEFLKEAMVGASPDVAPHDDLAEKVGLDSMGAVDFVTLVEEEFGLEQLSPEEISGIRTLNDAADLVLGKMENK